MKQSKKWLKYKKKTDNRLLRRFCFFLLALTCLQTINDNIKGKNFTTTQKIDHLYRSQLTSCDRIEEKYLPKPLKKPIYANFINKFPFDGCVYFILTSNKPHIPKQRKAEFKLKNNNLNLRIKERRRYLLCLQTTSFTYH